ncbi:hypothetical protein ACFVS7_16500 [Streptomyces rubiginosohelvolus]|uniref:DUF7638 domain-containing protein n=1 Tax=Streptomyces rubiginosohelvolus TaxID=67362 RepID=UPI0036DD3BF0
MTRPSERGPPALPTPPPAGRIKIRPAAVYTDGLIDCWGLVTIEEFEEKLRTGRVATTLPDGAGASAHDLASWKSSGPKSRLTPGL